MGICNVWIHFIWATRACESVLTEDVSKAILKHIVSNADIKKINLDCVSAHLNHVHALVNLKSTQTIARVIQLIKGESSHWANENQLLTQGKLTWQDDYIAASLSESELDETRQLIMNQKDFHRNHSFSEECRKVLYGTD